VQNSDGVVKPDIEEEKKIDKQLMPEPKPKEFKRLEKVERKPSIDFSKLDPSTFKEKFKGFGKEDYAEVLKANSDFFKNGYSNYVRDVKKGM
jgi:hypothetical protein